MNRKVAAFFVFMVLILLMAHSHWQTNKQRAAGVTSFSDAPKGVSLFRRYVGINQPNDEDVLMRRALLSTELLPEGGLLVINSPRRPLSELEAKNAAAFVKGGGKIFLSFHKEQQYFLLKDLIQDLGLEVEVTKNHDYTNGEVQTRSPGEDSWLLRHEESYAFYSPLKFNDDRCTLTSIECFFRQVKAGDGWLIVNLGLPLFGNGLIRRVDNSKFAVRLSRFGDWLKIDEYHHFFPEKTLPDLLREPRFILPVGAVFAVTLLFFLFGYSRLYELGLERMPESTTRSYHDFGAELIGQRMRRAAFANDAARFQAEVMMQMYPRYIDEISTQFGNATQGKVTNVSGTKAINALVKLHKNILMQLGKVKDVVIHKTGV